MEATYAYEMDQATNALERQICEMFPTVKYVYVKAAIENGSVPHSVHLLGQEMSLAKRHS